MPTALGEILNPAVTDGAPLPSADELPESVLYSIAADIGGVGLAKTAAEGSLAAFRAGVLGKVVAYSNHQREIDRRKIKSLALHPARLLSNMKRETYYAAKKQYLDWIAARELKRGDYDCFHGWSSDSLRTLIAARSRGVPSMIEIPTWHRNKFNKKPFYTQKERDRPDTWRERIKVSRQQMLTEYDMADLVLVQSEMSAETFIEMGRDPSRIFYVGRGVDPDHFRPARYPDRFTLVFVGSLKKRKGVHHLLRVWRKLALKNAELVLVGTVHPEIEPVLRECAGPDIVVRGFVQNVADEYRAAAVHIFPSECEGSAKCTYEAAACGLPQITTREAGDVVQHEVNGLLIPPNDPDALAAAIQRLHADRDLCARLGAAGRERVVNNFTWEHFRQSLLAAYEYAATRK